MWLWQDKNKSLLNQKDSGKNNKEIKKSQLLFNSKEYKEELPTKPEDNKSPKEPNNTKLNTKPHKEPKLTPEDKPKSPVKSTFQPNQDLPSLLEFEVSINSTPDQLESSDS